MNDFFAGFSKLSNFSTVSKKCFLTALKTSLLSTIYYLFFHTIFISAIHNYIFYSKKNDLRFPLSIFVGKARFTLVSKIPPFFKTNLKLIFNFLARVFLSLL